MGSLAAFLNPPEEPTMGRFLTLGAVFVVCAAAVRADDTPAQAKTRDKLKQKISVEFKETQLKDVVEELKDKVEGLTFLLDQKGGVSGNKKFTYKAADKPLEGVLDEMFKKENLGYYVIGKEEKAYEGSIRIKVGNERGSLQGQDIAKKPDDKKPDDKKPDDKKTDDKKKPEDKKADDKKPDDKKADPPKTTTDDTSDDRAERAAAAKLRAAKKLVENNMKDRAIEVCDEIIKAYPNTKTAEEAKKLADKLDK
jgi:hypothetical protein